MKQRIKNILQVVLSPAFLTLLLVSAVLWFISRLSHEYTASITIDVELNNDFGASMWVENKPIKVKAMVKGDGRDLILYKIGLGSRVTVPFSMLTVTQDPNAQQYMCRIEESSMLRALSSEQNMFQVVMITDTISQIRVSSISSTKLPVRPDFEMSFTEQYTIKGNVQLTPDSVEVKAPLAILDTLEAIYTSPLEFKDLSTNVNGTVMLKKREDIATSSTIVRYNINVVGFTEIVIQKPIETTPNLLVTPTKVNIVAKIPFELSEESFKNTKVYLTDNYVDQDSLVRGVLIKGMPKEVIEWSVEPEFVECYKIKTTL